MKNINALAVFTLLMLSICLISCEAIAGIFKVGTGFGIFLVVAIVAVIGGIVMWIVKGSNN